MSMTPLQKVPAERTGPRTPDPVRASAPPEKRAGRARPARRVCGSGAAGDGCGVDELPRVLAGAPQVQGMMQLKRRMDARPSSLPDAAALQRQAYARVHPPRPASSFSPPQTAAGDGGGVVQRVFTFQPGLTAPGPKRANVRALLTNVADPNLAALRLAPNVDVQFNLDDQNDVNPGETLVQYQNALGAWQHLGVAPAPGVQYGGVRVVIDVRDWFVDKYDTGTVVSMFMHELGAHVLPYTQTLIDLTAPGGAGPGALAVLTGTDQYQEHLDTQNPGNQAHQDYALMMQNMAAELGGNMAMPAEAASALNGFLMDLATIDATGRRIKFPRNPGGIAADRDFWRASMPWMGAHGVAANTTGMDVAKHYGAYYVAGLPAGLKMVAGRHPYLATAAGGALLATLWGTGALGWMAGTLGIGG